ncbi:flavodoxin family protein [Lacrimispora xylanolytica]|uniref:Flavodoxin family protein n=1 Tax=Lacrimispora xylanolytica TaxID=29375 RepID=A0ABY7AGD4_9FIRM|nr:flavodoxin family protein [Lacrimispora xylanolytica]WAJ25298.1 flavodoxin family protein [Lacrimispora xylanolytica]
MAKRIVLLNGSPRKNGNTELLANAFIKGAKDSGNTVTSFHVGRMKISGCMDCKYCHSHPGECVQKDDMQEIYNALYRADILVFASPVYWFGMTAHIKSAIDRMYAASYKEMPITSTALLAVYEDTNTDTIKPTISQYKAMIQYLGWKDCGIITQSEVLNKGDIEGKQSLTDAENLGKSIQ